MQTNKYINHLDKLLLLIVASLLLVLSFGWRIAEAHESDEGSHDHQESVLTFTEEENKLILSVDTSIEGGFLFLNENDQAIWQYIGPGSIDDIGCEDVAWESVADQAKTIQATVEEASDDVPPTKGSFSLNLREDANSETWYCFRIPVLVNDKEVFFFFFHELEEAPSLPDSTFIFSPALPAAGSEVPASVSVEISGETDVNPASWEHVQVNSIKDCEEDNEEISFESLPENNTLELTGEDAESVFCFRVMTVSDASGAEGDYLYEAYKVPGSSANNEDSSDSSNINWIFIVLVIAAIGIIIFFVVRSAKSKN